MMPLVGDKSTLLQMAVYSFALVAVTLTLGLFGAGWIYLATASILGWAMIQRSLAAFRTGEPGRIKSLFRFSIYYLFGLFLAIMVDAFVSARM
jgi:protoheme IX farnesyltransferase